MINLHRGHSRIFLSIREDIIHIHTKGPNLCLNQGVTGEGHSASQSGFSYSQCTYGPALVHAPMHLYLSSAHGTALELGGHDGSINISVQSAHMVPFAQG